MYHTHNHHCISCYRVMVTFFKMGHFVICTHLQVTTVDIQKLVMVDNTFGVNTIRELYTGNSTNHEYTRTKMTRLGFSVL